MPWDERSAMDEKLRFVREALRLEAPMTVLCERYGISRQTGHLWRRRYLEEGLPGLEERSRAPHGPGRRTSASVIVRIVEARRGKPYWGPKKLLKVLSERWPGESWPGLSTISEILRREGLSEPRRRRRRRRSLTVEQPFAGVTAANDAWCIDFKGWFRTGNGVRCDPLTVSDAHSRYLLGLRILPPVTSSVERAMGIGCFGSMGCRVRSAATMARRLRAAGRAA